MRDRGLGAEREDARSIVHFCFTDIQAEFANVIVINKTDLVTESLNFFENTLRKLNPDATLIRSHYGRVDLRQIMNTKLFSYQKAQQSAGWIKELTNVHTPETEEYGVSSFVFRDPRPFHPVRLWQYVQHRWPAGVIRSKGVFWLASNPSDVVLWSQAGGSSKAEIYGRWYASLSNRELAMSPSYMADQMEIRKRWNSNWGDRLNELVIIGIDMDAKMVRTELEQCLCRAEEMEGVGLKETVANPWPLWDQKFA